MLSLPPRGRRCLVVIHAGTYVGWIGAVVGFVAVATAGATLAVDSADARGLYTALSILLGAVIVPLAGLSFASGVVVALATPWGLFRHWWVVIKLVLTTGATVALLLHRGVAQQAAEYAVSARPELASLQTQLLVDAIAGLAVLLLAALLGLAQTQRPAQGGRVVGVTWSAWLRSGRRQDSDAVGPCRVCETIVVGDDAIPQARPSGWDLPEVEAAHGYRAEVRWLAKGCWIQCGCDSRTLTRLDEEPLPDDN